MTYLEMAREEAKAKGVKIGILKMEFKSANGRKWAEDFYYEITMDGKRCWDGYAENFAEAKAHAIEHLIKRSDQAQEDKERLQIAAQHYLELKDRRRHPVGKYDGGGRWYPAQEHACCTGIRGPSRAYPYSLMTHCRTAQHVAAEYGVEKAAMKKAAKAIYQATKVTFPRTV